MWHGRIGVNGGHDGGGRATTSSGKWVRRGWLNPSLPLDIFILAVTFHPNQARITAARPNHRARSLAARCRASLILSRHCTMAIPFNSSDRATSGAFYFDFYTANYQSNYTKVALLSTSSNFVIRILTSYSLDQA
jgi:hypothetical protein